jgi:PAS domain S-box-containing protein
MNIPTEQPDEVLELIQQFAKGNYKPRLPVPGNGQYTDALSTELNRLGEKLEAKALLAHRDEERIQRIMNVLIKYTVMDFSETLELSDAGDELDAISAGLNTIREEFVDHVAQLTANEKKYRLVIEGVKGCAIYMLDTNGGVATWNAGAEEILGYKAAEIMGKNISTFYLPEESRAEVPTHYLKIAKDRGKYETEGWRVKKDGSTFWANVVYTALYNEAEEHYGFLKIIRDNTKRKKAEDQLQEYKHFFDHNNDLCGIANTEGYFETINTNFSKALGYTEKEFCAIPFITLIHPDDVASTLQINENLKAGALVINFTNRYRKKEGSYLWLEWNATPNTITGKLYCVARDITERKKVQEQLEAVNKELESFSYSVSHDLRAPLRAVHGYAQILSEDYGKQLDPEAHRLLKNVMVNAKKMGQLIDDLLAFSRLGRKELVTKTVDMNQMVGVVQKELTFEENEREIQFNVGKLASVPADAVIIKQVWINLISNALKYSRLKEKTMIEIGSRQNGKEVIYHIKDNGAGFDMRYADKLFGVFQRLHSEAEFEGTGVGLAIVHRIITRHGGKVWAESTLNEGATFYFSLPK